jgi:RNA polymerase sigma factor (sigma-70 family)
MDGRAPEQATETIYIVDDDRSFVRGLKRLLSAAGLQVAAFSSSAEFLAPGSVPEDAPGCVVLDVRMPGMPGPELHRAMLDRGIDLPVIFLSAHGDIPTTVDAMRMGAVDFLEKPVKGAALIAAIRAALERQVQAREAQAVRDDIDRHLAALSERERQVLDHVITGRLNKQIADDLGISLKTVKAHRGRMMEKMDARSVAHLVDMCRTAEVAPAPQPPQGRPR